MHQDSHGLNSEFEWMLQSSEINDALLSEALIQKYYSALYQLTLSITGEPNIAAHAARQAIISAVAARHRYSGEFSLRVWLYSFGYRAARKSGQKKMQMIGGEISNGEDHPGSKGLSKYMLSLDKKHSLPIILRYVHKLSLEEIGHVLGIRERAVHSRFNTFRKQSLTILYPGSEEDPPHSEIGVFMREALDGLFEGKNSFEYQARLEMHLDECRECTAYNALLSKTEEQIRLTASQVWPVEELSESRVEDLYTEMLAGTSSKRIRQSFSLSMKTLSVAVVVVFLFAFTVFSMDLFESAESEQGEQIDTGISLASQNEGEITGQGFSRNLPKPTGVGPATRRDGYPLLSGPYLPPRINLRLMPQAAVVPEIFERLGWNNSGPISLYQVLGYWGWQGELEDILAELQPEIEMNHITPQEMVGFILQETELSSLWRFGGDLDLLKLLVAGGYPVIVAKGAEDPSMQGWFAHYAVIHGYSDQDQIVRLEDLMLPEREVPDLPYEDFIRDWRTMNYTFLVIYPPLQEARVFELLGDFADEVNSMRAASRLASSEARSLTGRDKFFAAFNHGTSHAYLGEHDRAASAFNGAMEIYKSLPEEERPWRILWYEPSPYIVYQETGTIVHFSHPMDGRLLDWIMAYAMDEEVCITTQEDLAVGRGGGGESIRIYSNVGSEGDMFRLIVCTQN
jgi:DNA-directed RNA polymerase specialized sigma24 family protein